MPEVLTAENLTKDFSGFRAVDNISFEIEKGEILGFLGPNGAGKTTTIMMLLGLTKPTSGKIRIFNLDLGKDRQKILQRVNFSSAYTVFSGRLTVEEYLLVMSYLYEVKNPKEKIKSLLESFEIYDLRNELSQNLSSGQLTRMSLCKAFLNDPELLFLDEPTASLDPDIAKKVREYLYKIRTEKNISMLFTSHDMKEVTEMCDRVIFLQNGKIVASGTPLGLTKLIKDCVLTVVFDASLKKIKEVAKKLKLSFEIPQPNTLEITLKEEEIGETLTKLAKKGIAIVEVDIEKPNLEDVFLKISQNGKTL